MYQFKFPMIYRYLEYGEKSWKELATKALNSIETYSEDCKNNFLSTLDWLHEHACSRTYGLGKYTIVGY